MHLDEISMTKFVANPHPTAGVKPYKNALHCLTTTMKNEGVAGLYKGFWANFTRIGSWNVVMFFTFEQVGVFFFFFFFLFFFPSFLTCLFSGTRAECTPFFFPFSHEHTTPPPSLYPSSRSSSPLPAPTRAPSNPPPS